MGVNSRAVNNTSIGVLYPLKTGLSLNSSSATYENVSKLFLRPSSASATEKRRVVREEAFIHTKELLKYLVHSLSYLSSEKLDEESISSPLHRDVVS